MQLNDEVLSAVDGELRARNMRSLPNGDFFSTTEILALLRHPPAEITSDSVPTGYKENVSAWSTTVQTKVATSVDYGIHLMMTAAHEGRVNNFPYTVGPTARQSSVRSAGPTVSE